jgi:MFS family permease
LVVNLVGVDGLFGLVAILIGLCALLVWPLPAGLTAPVQPSQTARSFAGLWRDIREVGGFMRGDRVTWLAVLHWTLGASLGIVIAMLAPAFSVDVLGVRAEDSVFVLAPAGVGMVLGTVLLGRIGQRWEPQRLIVVGLFVVGLSLSLLGTLRPVANLVIQAPVGAYELSPDGPSLWLILTVMATTLVAGVAFVAIIVAAQTIIQMRAPVAIRGRVFAVQLMLSNAVSILPLVFLGGLADVIGVGRALALLGLGVLAAAFLTVRAHRRLREAASLEPEQAPPAPEPRVTRDVPDAISRGW